MKNLNTLTREVLVKNTNAVRVLKLTNGSSINKFKKDLNQSLSDGTYNKIGESIDYEIVQVMVPKEASSETINTINQLNEAFILKLDTYLKEVKENEKSTKKTKVEKVKKGDDITVNDVKTEVVEPTSDEPVDDKVMEELTSSEETSATMTDGMSISIDLDNISVA